MFYWWYTVSGGRVKNNGFTLIEILGVIVVLSVIALITIPLIDRTINKGKNNLETSQKQQLIKALKDYYSDYNHSKTMGATSCRKISELMSSGNLPDGVKNPLTGSSYDSEDKVCVEKTGGNTSVYETNIKYKYYVVIGGNTYYE